MSGTTYDVSARGNKMTTSVDLRRATKKALAELSALIAGGGNHIVDVAIASDGSPETSGSGSGAHPALVVMWRGMRIGALRATDAAAYAQLNRILASGFSPTTVARVKKGAASGSAAIKIDVSLREPDVVVPVNNPPSSGNWVLMPSGNIIQVTGEDGHADYLRSILPASGRCQVLATLHAAKFGVRTKYDGVEVRLNGKRVGELSKAMGEKVLPAVNHFRALGCVTVSRAFIDGSGDVPQVTLECARAADLTDADLEPEVSPLPKLAPVAANSARRSALRTDAASRPTPAPESPFTNPFSEKPRTSHLPAAGGHQLFEGSPAPMGISRPQKPKKKRSPLKIVAGSLGLLLAGFLGLGALASKSEQSGANAVTTAESSTAPSSPSSPATSSSSTSSSTSSSVPTSAETSSSTPPTSEPAFFVDGEQDNDDRDRRPYVPAPPAPLPPTATPQPQPAPAYTPPADAGGGVYYANCAEARAAGAAPIPAGAPGYRPGLDRNNDLVACEL
ncbi:excalibur calcium-binding domain-containing protein [Corynebacterium sp. NPDC060344]|uniref:excalibur calcium-binding domain-containing protein n=1 Tax=Corynebacterium sp. NPDC060344 TaxID=3347101 RepID=UPI0036584828